MPATRPGVSINSVCGKLDHRAPNGSGNWREIGHVDYLPFMISPMPANWRTQEHRGDDATGQVIGFLESSAVGAQLRW